MASSGPRYSQQAARAAIAASSSYAEALRRLGMRPAGGNHRTLKHYAQSVWHISTDHFDPGRVRRAALAKAVRRTPLDEILVVHSPYARSHLKERLYDADLKQRECEACGQGEEWRGAKMSLILDHVNGCATDNRIENLRILCPNCAATLDTHCGKMLKRVRTERPCRTCGALFYPDYERREYCSQGCWGDSRLGRANMQARRTTRPTYDLLRDQVAESGYAAVGRLYGVSDNAVRKWVRQYEHERTAADRLS